MASRRSTSSRRSFLAGILPVTVSGAARAEAPRFRFQETHMGVLAGITLTGIPEREAAPAAQAAFRRIAQLDRILSDYSPASEVSRLRGSAPGRAIPVSPDFCTILAPALRLSAETGGAFDVTAAPVVRLWRQARRRGALPDRRRVEEALGRCGYRNLRLDAQQRTVTLLKPGMQLDFGGIAKGFAASQALAVLRDRGIPSALVALAGDIAAGSAPPDEPGWRIAVESIDARPDRPTCVVRLANRAISTSAPSEQHLDVGGVRYSHIIDPRTGQALTLRRGVTVVAAQGLDADGFATALSVLGDREAKRLLRKHPGTEALRVLDEVGAYRYQATEGFRRITDAVHLAPPWVR